MSESKPRLKLNLSSSRIKEQNYKKAEIVGSDFNNTPTPINKLDKDKIKIEDKSVKKKRRRYIISNEDYQNRLKYFQEKYPKCFTIPPSPLAIGIHNEILKQEIISRTKLKSFLRRYTQAKAYRENLTVGRVRLFLDGSISSQVLEIEADQSKWQEYLKLQQKAQELETV